MLEIKLGSGSYLLVEVPKESGFYDIWWKELYDGKIQVLSYDPNLNTAEGAWEIIPLPKEHQWQLLGLAKDLDAEQIDKMLDIATSDVFLSLNELLKSHNLTPSTTLILKQIN